MRNSILKISINYVSEKDIDLLIIEEFISNREFANLFMNLFEIKNYKLLEVHHSMIDVTYGESDIFFLIDVDRIKIGLFIEDKIDAVAMPNQYERYKIRAEKLMDQGHFDQYYIFITAPIIYLDTNEEAKKYPYKLSYEEMLSYFVSKSDQRSVYKATLIKSAIEKKLTGYIPIEDEAVTNFWQRYYEFKNQFYPHLILNEVKGPRGANATWPWFDTEYKHVRIAHKADRGIVDLTFGKLENGIRDLRKNFSDQLEEDMRIIKTGKSMSIRIKVPKIDFKDDFSKYIEAMHESLQVVDRFYKWISTKDIISLYDGY